MLAMAALALVSATDVDDMRARAHAFLQMVAGVSEYSATRGQAVLDALDVVGGTADPDDVYRRSVLAFDEEQQQVASGEPGTYPGVFAVTLQWSLGMAPAPI